MRTISLVVPLHNEQDSLSLLVKAIDDVFTTSEDEYEIIFVDDGSTDQSFEILKKIKQEYGDRFTVMRFTRNYGKSAALSVAYQRSTGRDNNHHGCRFPGRPFSDTGYA